MKYITGILSSLAFCAFLVNQECYAAVAVKSKSSPVAKITTASKITTRRPTVELSKEWIEKYQTCLTNCSDDGMKLECGANGIWFLNKCHRDCQGMEKSKSEKKDCTSYHKEEFTLHWTCAMKCDDKGEKRECGKDGLWYDNSCRRSCYGIELSDKKFCEQLDKADECNIKCANKTYKPQCGVDGKFHSSECHRNCMGVKAGTEGKECKTRSPVLKYWMCQAGCAEQEIKEECSKEGHWFYNTCHRECHGEKLGDPKKDCKEDE